MWYISTIAAVIAAVPSAIGTEYHIPSSPKKFGRMSKRGTRKSSWRVSDRNMLMPALPMLWKNPMVIIWNHMMGTTRFMTLSACAASFKSSSSFVNALATGVARSTQTMKPTIQMPVAMVMAYFRT